MELANILRHPFFKGVIKEDDYSYKEDMKAIGKQQMEMAERLDKLKATLDGEGDWMLTLTKTEKLKDG